MLFPFNDEFDLIKDRNRVRLLVGSCVHKKTAVLVHRLFKQRVRLQHASPTPAS